MDTTYKEVCVSKKCLCELAWMRGPHYYVYFIIVGVTLETFWDNAPVMCLDVTWYHFGKNVPIIPKFH